ncbi:MAG: hypothetical protein ACR2GG_04370 [Gemmatimonadaceae bacterium]
MYAGHVGFALGAYSFRRTLPLWLLIVAAQAPDWLDAGYCIANVGRGPYGLFTHGVIAIAAAAITFAVITYAVSRDPLGALIVAAVVISHYGLDYFTGHKPTWAGGPVVGLNLYTRPIADVIIESITVLGGWLLYRHSLPRAVRDDGMVYGILFSLIALQAVAGIVYALNMTGHVKC